MTFEDESDIGLPTLEQAYEMDQRQKLDDQILLERQIAHEWDMPKEYLNDSDIEMQFE